MKKQILYMLCATALLSSCHIYKSYEMCIRDRHLKDQHDGNLATAFN